MYRKLSSFLLAFLLVGCLPEVSFNSGNQSASRPVALFTLTVVGRTVHVDANETAVQNSHPNLTYAWDFNNEISATGITGTHTFDSDGEKFVKLLVSQGDMTSAPAIKRVTLSTDSSLPINNKPTASFLITTDGLKVSLDASASTDLDDDDLTYEWDLNGEITKQGKTTTHTFSEGGDKTISLVVSDGNIESELSTQTVNLTAPITNVAPVANFVGTVTNLTVAVDASTSSDVNDDDLSYAWSFGTEATKTGKQAEHTFATEGDKSITLVVSDGKLNSTPQVKVFTVSEAATPVNNAPEAKFTVQQTGLMVALDASLSSDADGDALLYTWYLNGEATLAGLNVTHEFASAGEKTITLVVHDGTAYSLPSVQTVVLVAPVENTAPVAMFTVQQTGLMVELDATQSSDADGDALTYAWSLNGEAAPTGLNVSYEFASAGEKAITLIVHDGTIYSLPSVQTITLAPSVENTAPVANFTVEVEGLTVTVNGSTSTDAESNPLTYSWDFAGEAIKTGVTSSYTFTTEGSKSISLTVNDGLLDSAAVAKVVMVEAPELDYETALNYITPFVEESCLFCHSTSPAGSAEISYGLALTPAEVKNGIVAYLTKYPDSVEKVQNKPTLETLNHGGLKPFSGSPKRENWIAAVEGIALELSGDPDVGEGEIIFTEDYENQTVNENPSGWGVNYQYNIVPNPTPTQFSDAIKVTNEFAHTGTKALYVDGRDLASAMRYSFKTLTLPNDKERVFVRYYLRSTEYIGNRAKNPDGSDPNHNHFMALENGQSDEIRIGEIKGALGVNEFGRDDIVPTAEYWYGQIETPRIEADTWYCVETAFLNDGSKPELKTWLNEELVTHIDDHTDFKNGAAVERWLDNKFGKVSLGWANYQTYDTEVYFDDVVVSTERIGCM